MELLTNRLSLVPLGIKYLESTHAYASDLENAKYMVYLPNLELRETIEFLEGVDAEWKKDKPEFYEFAILLEGKHIGAVCLYLTEQEREGELGWIIHKHYWAKGYALEAAREIIRFANTTLQINKFIAFCDSENVGSYRLMEKLGMVFEHQKGGRKNKSSEEERIELKYSMEMSD